MATTEYHVTRTTDGGVDGGSVFGHLTKHCGKSTCCGPELYLGTTNEINGQQGDVVELEDEPGNASLATEATARAGEAVRTKIEVVAVTANNPSPSDCVPGGVDVSVEVTLSDGQELRGTVSLYPSQYNGQPVAYGDAPDYWVDGWLLTSLRDLDQDVLRRALDRIEAVASAVVPGHWVAGRYIIDPDVLAPEENWDDEPDREGGES